jgi:hypothetical protein
MPPTREKTGVDRSGISKVKAERKTLEDVKVGDTIWRVQRAFFRSLFTEITPYTVTRVLKTTLEVADEKGRISPTKVRIIDGYFQGSRGEYNAPRFFSEITPGQKAEMKIEKSMRAVNSLNNTLMHAGSGARAVFLSMDPDTFADLSKACSRFLREYKQADASRKPT